MRESIGSALLLNIVIVIVGVISAFLISSIAYSKAFKAKNRIISAIEYYDGANGKCFDNFEDKCFIKAEEYLTDMGYSSNIRKTCGDPQSKSNQIGELVYGRENDNGHRYCVYKYTMCQVRTTFDDDDNTIVSCRSNDAKSYYYKVVTFMHFDIPLIGNFLEFPVSGETKTYIESLPN